MTLPWEAANAEEHVRLRQPVMEIQAPPGIRTDLPKRRPADALPEAIRGTNVGVVVMSHRGYSNGRLSVLLSSIPENYYVVVSDDTITDWEVRENQKVCRYHGATHLHCVPWGGRATNARHSMAHTSFDVTIHMCDDAWLFPEAILSAVQWNYRLRKLGLPLACLTIPGWETFREHPRWGFESWEQCLAEPWRFEAIPPNPVFQRGPSLHKNPFGAAMLINRDAYEQLGGFAQEYWAHDDVFNHKVWMSDKWVNAMYYGRGYMHLGAQSWHHGESDEFVGTFEAATGIKAEESGHRQYLSMLAHAEHYGKLFLELGGTPIV